MGFKRPLVQLQSLGPKKTRKVLVIQCFAGFYFSIILIDDGLKWRKIGLCCILRCRLFPVSETIDISNFLSKNERQKNPVGLAVGLVPKMPFSKNGEKLTFLKFYFS